MVIYSKCTFFSYKNLLILFILAFHSSVYAINNAYLEDYTYHHAPLASKQFWNNVWGVAAPEPRLTLGMWSVHATEKNRNNNNDMIGFTYQGIGFGTFINSYWERAYALTFQRYWTMGPLYKDINYEIGYRLGLVTGYKGYNITGTETLKEAPIIPFVQLIAALNWKYFGWEVSIPDPYVISTSFYIRFL